MARDGFVMRGLAGGESERERVALAVAFVLFAGITFWCALHHEAWSDEGDPWLLARDAPFADMLVSASNGGVPLLFHLSVLPFARAGLPYFAMQFLNLLYVWAAVLVLFRSPAFPAAVKVLFAFSYFPAFEFGVIPRPYGLQMLLMFATAAAWRERHVRPLRIALVVALLANTTSLGLVIAAVAGALLLWERARSGLLASRPILASTAIMIAGGLLAAAQLWPRPGRQHVYTFVSIDTLWYALASTFFPEGRVDTFLIPALIVLAIVTFGISRSFVPLVFLYVCGTAMLLVYIFVWMGGIRHAGLLLLLVISAVWIAEAYGPYRQERLLMAALAVSLACSIVPAVRSWVLETRYAFSGSREVADFLIETGLTKDAVLVSHPMFWTAPLVYLPGTPICDPAEGRCRTYSRWLRRDYELSKIPRERVIEMAEEQFAGQRWVYITHTEIPEPRRARYRLLFRTQVQIWRMWGERYLVYEPR